MQAHHQHYIEILRQTGAQVVELPALEAYPDATFVEDTALCLREVAVLMRSGA
jgi:dimethylargininase